MPERGHDGRLALREACDEPTPWPRGSHDLADGQVLMVVPDVAPRQPAAVLVFFHGAGGDGRQSLSLVEAEAARRGIVVVAPTSLGPTWDLLAGGLGPDVATLQSVLAELFVAHPVDRTRVAVGGFSDGASYALSIGLANGDVFSHVLAFSPGFAAPPARVGAPFVYVAHGVDDRVLPIDRTSRQVVPSLRHAGYDVTYHEFEGGHGVPVQVVAPGLDQLVAGSRH